MSMSISRPRLFEIADQPWCPALIRAHTQAVLTFLWVHRIPPFQSRAPYERAADVLDSLIRHVEEEQGSRSEKGKDKLRVVDCCSGAGGPMPLIERKINAKRTTEGLPPVPILLSDLHPHLSSWTQHKSQSPTSSLSFLPQPVDATNAPEAIRKDRHIRTFCLSFHHFDEDGARRVLADAMRSAEAICILELQEADLCSFLTLAGIFPLVFLVTPFLQPSISVLFFTYVVPIIPLVMLFDGWVSAWRTRRPSQVKRLAALASLTLSLEGGDKDGDCGSEWKWEHGRSTHTRPCGRMLWITGKKRRVEYDEDDQEAFYTDAETDGGL